MVLSIANMSTSKDGNVCGDGFIRADDSALKSQARHAQHMCCVNWHLQ
jgi:hypothetical protein